MKYGFVKVCAATPEIVTLDVKHNTRRIVDKIIEAHTLAAQVVLFPELCVTGYAMGDAVFNSAVLESAEDALKDLAGATSQRDIVAAVGLPVKIDSYLYNCMAVLARGQVAGLIPKYTLTRSELRQFTPYTSNIYEEVEYAGFVTPFHHNLLIKDFASELLIGVLHGNDFDTLEKLGVNLILQPCTRPMTVSSGEIVRKRAEVDSLEHACGLVYTGAGKGESASRCVYDSTKQILECGELLSSSREQDMLITDIDIQKVNFVRAKSQTAVRLTTDPDASMIEVKLKRDSEVLDREFDRFPYVPKDPRKFGRMTEILSEALYSRLKFTDAKTMVVGVSGGLDSLCTLLVADRVCEDYDFPRENVICVTMPCFASSERTAASAKEAIRILGMTHKHIPIHDAVAAHLKEIGHTGAEDLTYENAQARERTQILMDLANMTGGIMLGTGDMSEEALGFATFGGDAIAMFNVNSGLPKTAIRGLAAHLAENTKKAGLKEVIIRILDTPVSPELKRDQSTEEIVGRYDLHDFFLYHFLSGGCSPEKIQFLAEKAFSDVPGNEIKRTLRVFFKRFFAAQYKRNAAPDGVQVFDTVLSASGYSLNSDISGNLFK